MLKLKKLTEVEGKQKYRVKVLIGFAALQYSGPELDTVGEYIKISANESLAY
jgi:hypothetical protein